MEKGALLSVCFSTQNSCLLSLGYFHSAQNTRMFFFSWLQMGYLEAVQTEILCLSDLVVMLQPNCPPSSKIRMQREVVQLPGSRPNSLRGSFSIQICGFQLPESLAVATLCPHIWRGAWVQESCRKPSYVCFYVYLLSVSTINHCFLLPCSCGLK